MEHNLQVAKNARYLTQQNFIHYLVEFWGHLQITCCDNNVAALDKAKPNTWNRRDYKTI